MLSLVEAFIGFFSRIRSLNLTLNLYSEAGFRVALDIYPRLE
jgi:hypothetical protein